MTMIGEADRKVRHGVGRSASHHQDDVTFLGHPGIPVPYATRKRGTGMPRCGKKRMEHMINVGLSRIFIHKGPRVDKFW